MQANSKFAGMKSPEMFIIFISNKTNFLYRFTVSLVNKIAVATDLLGFDTGTVSFGKTKSGSNLILLLAIFRLRRISKIDLSPRFENVDANSRRCILIRRLGNVC